MSLQKHVFLSLADLVVVEYYTKGLGFLVIQRLCRISTYFPFYHICKDWTF